MTNTRFRRPTDDMLTRLATLALESADLPIAPDSWDWIEWGSASVVVLAGNAAVRISRDNKSAANLERSQAVVDSLPSLPFGVPRSLGNTVMVDGLTSVATQRLGGTPHPQGSGDRDTLRELLDAIRNVDPAPFAHLLAQRRAYAGGDQWFDVMIHEVIPRLPRTVRQSAREAADALAALPQEPLVFSHGDLAGGNVLWEGGRVAGVLDWDLSSLDDPAVDIAGLAGWHGWELLPALATADEQARAEVIRRTFTLQIVSFAIVNNRPQAEVDRAIARVTARFSEDQAQS